MWVSRPIKGDIRQRQRGDQLELSEFTDVGWTLIEVLRIPPGQPFSVLWSRYR